jgi:hypothetical protein
VKLLDYKRRTSLPTQKIAQPAEVNSFKPEFRIFRVFESSETASAFGAATEQRRGYSTKRWQTQRRLSRRRQTLPRTSLPVIGRRGITTNQLRAHGTLYRAGMAPQ